jgi:hypothetical protein
LDICNYVSMDLAEYVDKKDRLRNYEKMLQKLKNIKIWLLFIFSIPRLFIISKQIIKYI